MPSPPQKRRAEDSQALLSNKVQKLDQPEQHQRQTHPSVPRPLPPDATPSPATPSGSKKKSNASSSRTGQACDRCKTRKIRCDDSQGSCLPCLQSNTECVTTDRVTQRANVRGHVEHVEQDNAVLKHHLVELQQQLKDNGIEPKPPPQFIPLQPLHQQQWSQKGWKPDGREKGSNEANLFAQPTVGFNNCNGNNYRGVLSANSYLSHIKGTSLSVFGMEVDLADYISDEAEAPMSYAAMMTSITNARPSMTPPEKAKLPESLAECQSLAKTYLVALNPWMPALHRPDFLELVNNFYRPEFQPSSAQIVMIQMMLAILKYQNVTRNSDGSSYYKELREQSFAHYHFALSHMYALISSQTVADMQAMTMMCIHLRSFPKPGPAWMLTGWALWICVELGLHRSSKVWGGDSNKSEIECEMQRRVFWTLTLIHVSISGKLGRPMMLRKEDFDVELPQLLPDKLPSESKDHSTQICSVWPCIELFKLTELFLDMFSTLYTIRPTTEYESAIQHFEQRAAQWRDELPPTLKLGSPENKDPKSDANARVFALWLRFWESEFQLLMHHPAMCRTSSQEVISANLQKCIGAAWVIIDMFAQARAAKILDTTWHNATTFIAAIFTLLFGYWDRRNQISTEELLELKNRMNLCLDILGEIGRMLGSNDRLRNTIRQIIDTAIGHINRFLVEQTASVAVANASLNKSSQSLQATQTNDASYNNPQGYPPSINHGSHAGQTMPDGSNAYNGHLPRNPATDYPPAAQNDPYHQAPTATMQSPYNNTYNAFEPPPSSEGNSYTAVLGNSFAAQPAPAQPPQHFPTQGHPAYVMAPYFGSAHSDLGPQYSWQRFTESLRGAGAPAQNESAQVQPQPQEYLAMTGAMMSMGNGDQANQGNPTVPHAQTPVNMAGPPMSGGNLQSGFHPSATQGWPMSAGYDLGSSGLAPQ